MSDKSQPVNVATTASLPPEVIARLLANVDVISRRMARRLADELPLPSDFRRVGYLRSVIAACREGVRSLLDQLQHGTKPRPGELIRLGSAGARQAQLGVPLEVLLAAYRLAAKIVWQEVIAEATRLADLSPQTVVAVTGEVLEYLDEISAAVGRTYLETRERLMRQHDRERDRILRMLLAGEVQPEMRRLAAAHDVDLQPPLHVVACLVEGGGEPHPAPPWHGPGVLLVADEPGVWIALLRGEADPHAFAKAVIGADGSGAVVCGIGPMASTLAEVADAARRARQAAVVGRVLRPEVAVHDDWSIGVFGVLAHTAELRGFVEGVLGPLLALPESRRTDLLQTLESLVSHQSVGDAATALGLHRHTLVYRLQRLRELLRVDLDDAVARHHVWLALQGLRLIDSPAG